MNSDPTPDRNRQDQMSPTEKMTLPLYDAIALRAYFIALERHRNGEAADPLKDWLEAEQQLTKAEEQ
ncbi:MAG TPA: DUF2934 domain-containing protein [Chthoniobacter sp.]|jgi:hypothetical protein